MPCTIGCCSAELHGFDQAVLGSGMHSELLLDAFDQGFYLLRSQPLVTLVHHLLTYVCPSYTCSHPVLHTR